MRCNVTAYEPGLALFVPDDDPLRFYKALAPLAAAFLAPGGAVLVEINEALGPQTAALFAAAGLERVEVLPDVFSKNRFVRAFQRGSTPSQEVDSGK